MVLQAIGGISIPFWGTMLGAAFVFFMRGARGDALSQPLRRALNGFSAGVMTAASVWSLLIPAVEQSSSMGRWAFLPAAVGLWIGVLFLVGLDRLIPWLRAAEDRGRRLSRTAMVNLAVVLHNLPEGMAVGVIYAGYLTGSEGVTLAGALSLSLGIAIQNVPEGAIISMPLRAGGMKRSRAFLYGTLSGAVEPLGAALTVLAAHIVLPILPYCLSFAAGAMLYVVAAELMPESSGDGRVAAALWFCLGFTVMMLLDIAFS